MGRHVKQQFRLGIILAEHGESAVVRRARLGSNALGNLLLHHHRHRLKALGFQQGGEDGAGDVIGQVGAGHRAQGTQFLVHQGGDVLLEHIAPENFHIVAALQGDVQDGLEPLVHLHGAHLPGSQGKLLGQRPNAGADFQHAHVFFHPGLPGNGLRHPGRNEKILPLGLGEVKPVDSQQGLHHFNIANIYHAVFLRKIFSVIIPEKTAVFNRFVSSPRPLHE